jgi:hypothetical protein
MGDLARRRSARDLWISRSHLGALSVGVSVVVCTAFLIGMSIGQTRAAQEPTTSRAFVSASPDGGLVELLARVEASADPLGGIGELTFPDALSKVPETPIIPFGPPLPGGAAPAPVAVGYGDPAPMPIAEEPPEVIEVAPGPLAIAPIADQRPAGSFTVVVAQFDGAHGAVAAGELRSGLRAEGKPAFVTVELVKGVPRYLVAVGGYPDEGAAQAAAAELATSRPDLHGKVAPIR